ncbi:hypothetical protein ACFP65_06035 [Marinilactibacillus sp. GCM10026970]|uniref:hypothetical protein n=1 Tax=Marinilactibacillus sp. GCM10026970 TaxID=3252642 RepID=UPI00361F7F28
MKELFVIPMVLYGVLMGIMICMNRAKSKSEKLSQTVATENLMATMFGNELSKKKEVVIRIVLFQFILLFGYTLISLWLNFAVPIARYFILVMLLVLVVELITRIITLLKASSSKELVERKKISDIAPYIYLVVIAVSIGTML